MKKRDILIIGGGPAGYTAAARARDLGHTVAVIELGEEFIGGACLNRGCIPVKSLIESALLYEKIKKSSQFGIDCEAGLPNMEKIKASAYSNISVLRKNLSVYLAGKGIEFIYGRASFISPKTVEVKNSSGGREKISADAVVIASGSQPKPVPGIITDGKHIFMSDEVLASGINADKILIIGGGYIGCELASFYAAVGTDVTVAEFLPALLSSEDEEVSRTLEQAFKKKGIKVLTSNKAESLKVSSGSVTAQIASSAGGSVKEESFSRIIVCAGRAAAIENLGLDRAGVETKNGFIKVDKNMETTSAGIYAAGDVVDSPMLANVAYREGMKAAESAFLLNTPEINYNLVPKVVFSIPPVASVGLTEARATAAGLKVKVRKSFYKANAKAVIAHETSGFAKAVYDGLSDKLLGISIIGESASELIHVASPLIAAGMTAEEANRIMYAHPTLAEVLAEITAKE